ncbi:MAG: polysaccharide deacetylase family protein [Polyangiaceae bacterium]
MTIHVSIHDVSPVFEIELERAVAACAREGAKPSLLVVPNFHGQALLTDHPRFVDRLRTLAKDGHAIVLHGHSHEADGDRPGSGASRWFRQTVVSGGEAEFSSVGPDEAARRLDDGLRMLDDAGLPTTSFVPPAWSMPRWLLPVLRERGIRYTEDHFRAYDPVSGNARPTLVLNWASRSRGRMRRTIAFCRVAKYGRALVPTRLALHPGDMVHPTLLREVETLLAWGRGDYDDRPRSMLGPGR